MSVLTTEQRGKALVVHKTYPLARRVWGLVRIGLGWIFLWAFLDKTFALGFATGRAEDGTIDFFGDAAWINGGSPTEGFLKFAIKGPFQGFFQDLAGQVWVDWLFMIGLLAIGLGLIFGVGIRIAAITGGTLLVLMWAAGFIWPEHNPFLDDHLIYAVTLVGLAVANAGDTWGFGTKWGETELVQRYPILK